MSNTAQTVGEAIGGLIGVGVIVATISFGISACSGKKEEAKAAPAAVVSTVADESKVDWPLSDIRILATKDLTNGNKEVTISNHFRKLNETTYTVFEMKCGANKTKELLYGDTLDTMKAQRPVPNADSNGFYDLVYSNDGRGSYQYMIYKKVCK